jgi:menaquinone-dependent protoporphyrinogen oxidase
MARVLIAYGTRQGKAAEIAQRVAERIREAGHDVTTLDLRTRPEPSPMQYDAVIVGASAHPRGFEREVRRWVARRREELAARPNAFFAVSLTAAGREVKHDLRGQGLVNQFTESTGWLPDRVEMFAGALVYSRYNPLLRWVMKLIVRKQEHGRYTDTSRDYDFTDYEQVDAFAREFAASIEPTRRS